VPRRAGAAVTGSARAEPVGTRAWGRRL